MERFRFDDVHEWVEFFAGMTLAAAWSARDLAERIEQLTGGWIERLGNPRSDAATRALVERLPAEPVLSVARAAELAGVSNTAADNAIRKLQEAGIVVPLDAPRWGRRWEATAVFTLLDAFERELSSSAILRRPAPG